MTWYLWFLLGFYAGGLCGTLGMIGIIWSQELREKESK